MKHKHFLYILFLSLLTTTAFIKTFENGWTTWDDNVYVTDNHFVTGISIKNLLAVWTTSFNGSYLPLTMMTYMVDYAIGGFTPVVYHTTNFLLHVINTLLVYFFIVRLSKENHLAAVVVAIVFGIHPMHVESVAWISARKDVLSGFFFLLSLICYLDYVQKSKQKGLIYSFLFFALALFSKIVVLMLPLVLLLIDWYQGRTWHVKLITEKFSFFIVAAMFVLIGFYAQQQAGAIRTTSIGEMLLMPHYSLYFYLEKFLLPFRLSALYPYPVIHNGFFPMIVYASVPIIYCLAYVVWKFRANKSLLFGVLFFLVLIFPVLQHIRFSNIITADRFTYLPYIGLSYPMALWISDWYKNSSKHWKRVTAVAGVILLAVMQATTMERVTVWKDSTTLWNDVLLKYPHALQ